MKFQIQTIFKNLFFKAQAAPATPKSEIKLGDCHQPHVLRAYMHAANLTHDETVLADLERVRISESEKPNELQLYFCSMAKVKVIKQIKQGDMNYLPCEATLNGFRFDQPIEPGLYNLRNVKLHSNGTMQVIKTDDTVLEPFCESPICGDLPF